MNVEAYQRSTKMASLPSSKNTSVQLGSERKEQTKDYTRHFDELAEWRLTQIQQESDKLEERKAYDQKRAQQRRINDLRSRVAFLRSRVMNNKDDRVAAGELAMAKTQLYWSTNGLSSSGSGGFGF